MHGLAEAREIKERRYITATCMRRKEGTGDAVGPAQVHVRAEAVSTRCEAPITVKSNRMNPGHELQKRIRRNAHIPRKNRWARLDEGPVNVPSPQQGRVAVGVVAKEHRGLHLLEGKYASGHEAGPTGLKVVDCTADFGDGTIRPNVARIDRGISWRTVANEIGVSPSTLTRMAQGKRPDVDAFAAMVAWVGLPAERFMVDPPNYEAGDPMAEVIAILHGHPRLEEHEVRVLESVLTATYRSLRESSGD